MDDFSTEHLLGDEADGWNHPGQSTYGMMWDIVDKLNECRELYLKTKDKKYWWQMIQFLPSSYNQTRNVMMNYEVLANIYKSRKNHKLDEWREFCKWIEELPYRELVCGPDSLREKLNRPSCGVIPNALRESIGLETIPDSEAKRHLELGKAIGEGFRKGLGVKEIDIYGRF